MTKSSSSRTEKTNQVLIDISKAVFSSPNLDILYKKIHQSLKQVLSATNFFIALYDEQTNTARIQYGFDEIDTFINVDRTDKSLQIYEYTTVLTPGSLIAMVIRSKQPLLIKKAELIDYCNKNNCSPVGTLSECWLGVPIKVKEKTIGIIAVYSYNNLEGYSNEDIEFMSSVSDQLSMAIEKKMNEDSLRLSENRYQNLAENIKEVIYSTDKMGNITFVSSVVENLTGYQVSEIAGKNKWCRFPLSNNTDASLSDSFSKIIHPQDQQRVDRLIQDSLNSSGSFQTEYRAITKGGKEVWVFEKGQLVNDENGIVRLEGIILDINERKRAELINQTLFNISNAVNATFDMNELYRVIHRSLSQVIDLTNFFIAIYDDENDCITFPYDIDDKGNTAITEVNKVRQSTSLAGQVILTGKPLLLTKQKAYELVKEHGDELIGDPAELWLGTPLSTSGKVLGAMVTYSYTDPNLYSEKDIEIFLSVSDQVAIAIDRKIGEEKVQRRELQLRTMYEISNAIITTFNMEELYRSIHESLRRIIDVQNFGIALYDKEKDLITYPYLVDLINDKQKVVIHNASQSSSLTYEVIRRQESVSFCREEIAEYILKKDGKRIGYPSESWYGIPLKGKDKILGVIVIQSYNEPDHFKQKDIELLESVSGQIAFAIERKKAETDLAATQNELIEYAHKVGMADIANATLHNIGNILNSVKTSTELIQNINNNSQVESFKQANDLFKANKDQLDTFFTKDQKGQKLVEYYYKLEDSFSREKIGIEEQVNRLNEKIKLMTDVIVTQQGFTNTGFMTSEYALEGIINDVLTMQEESLARYKIRVVKDFKTAPPVLIQKTKLVHILINLVNNAKDSMMEVPENQRELRISVSFSNEEVKLSMKDTGIGISDEIMGKIFTHGFTTKANGHGFGLHNSAIYLEEMSGKIWVESKGAGEGASFFITLPRSPYFDSPSA